MEALEETANKAAGSCYKDIQEQFRRAINDIQMDIERWYYRIADNNEISYSAAKKLLKKNELEEFRWTVEQYIKAGEENAIDQRWIKQLENASAKVHISRLEAMKTSIQQHAELLYSRYENGSTEFLAKRYKDSYYQTAFEIMKGTGIGADLHAIDTRKIEIVLAKPWAADEATFSDRIWKDKNRLINTLYTELSQHIIRGESVDKMIANISKTMNASRNQAGRLIMTESAAISSAATKECYRDLDVEQFEVLATLDSRTSEICRQMDGKITPVSDYKIGVTAPPFHPFCRSTTVPYFNDEFTDGEKRAARGEDGKTYYVPANMKYEEWYDKFVEKGSDNDIIKLKDEEQYALNKYLSFEAYNINEKLRSGIQLNNTEKTMVRNLDSALKKMPYYKGNLSRSLYFGEPERAKVFISKFHIDDGITFSEYISTTNASELYNPEGEVQIFIRNAKKGRNITAYNSAEAEVLYERGSKFKVKTIIKTDERYNIFLEEL